MPVPPQVLIWHWIAFGFLIASLLALDLLVFHRHARAPTLRESAGWSVFWIVLALLFNGFVWWWQGPDAGLRFLAGYLVEKSLSVDNLFVFLVIFRFFRVHLQYQYRVLFWGIIGAVVTRLVFILAGTELIHQFRWMECVFGVFLVYTGAKLALHSGAEVHPENNVLLRVARRVLRVSQGDHREHGDRFLVRQDGRWHITPLLLVLLVIESTDVLFAVDSVPAIIGITKDRFLVFTSNIFAILGLRALYFLLAGVMDLFRYLHYGLAAVLVFIGLKMVFEFASPGMAIPVWTSLLVILAILSVSVLASVVVQRREDRRQEDSDGPPPNPPA